MSCECLKITIYSFKLMSCHIESFSSAHVNNKRLQFNEIPSLFMKLVLAIVVGRIAMQKCGMLCAILTGDPTEISSLGVA